MTTPPITPDPEDTGEYRVVRRTPKGSSGWSTPKRVAAGALACVLLVGVLAGAGAAWGLWSFSKIQRVDLNLAEVESPTEPMNVLVVGSDSRADIEKGDPGAGGMLGKDAPTGQRADSLLIARIDPSSDRIDLLSVPRDLWVPKAGTDSKQRINSAYAQSAQAVVDSVQSSLGIPINHFVEVDFSGFQSLVEAIGGVPMYFDHPVRDGNSGLDIGAKGCHVLDGQNGLAFARSRHLEWNNGVKWVSDPTGDLGRMTRQQLLTRAAMAKAQTLGLNNVGTLKSLVDAGLGSVKLDDSFGTSDLLGLGKKFSNFDPERLQTHSLPVVPFRTDGGAAVVLLDDAAAQPVLDLFRGTAVAAPVTTTTAPPPSADEVTVSVVNATGKEGEARRVSFVLVSGDFIEGAVEPSDKTVAHTVVSYPKGQKRMADLVAPWISVAPELKEDKKLPSGTVTVTLGVDFKRVAEPDASATTTTVASATSAAPGGTAAPAVTATTEPGWKPGVPPEGTSCP
ncbi:unannotated protein [freshwater metagenome]|uniref:Unannotated protein n=1 Tax=freshwater metagenome TaxID=449393 RepID=A0A6J6B8L7_9ZZZZ|nr:hypothetical protein [Actinomycetota bacterium]MSY78120.1 hypothetical protein [Actinomycetota bacterium]MTA63401.1 hypothetical protein [Actinomycetota bacterium]